MRTTLTMIIGCFFLCGFQCRQPGEEWIISIQGFRILDAVGNPLADVGTSNDDWVTYNTLDDRIMNLFNFNTTLTLDNTVEATVNTPIAAYPNPFANLQYYAFGVSDSVLLKAVVVNESLYVLEKVSHKFKGYYAFTIDYSDRTKFPNRSSFRVYYSFSAAGKPNFKVGYGDIRICEGQGGSSYTDCFK